jgi:hypothetical protein
MGNMLLRTDCLDHQAHPRCGVQLLCHLSCESPVAVDAGLLWSRMIDHGSLVNRLAFDNSALPVMPTLLFID